MPDHHWTCNACGTTNAAGASRCVGCGAEEVGIPTIPQVAQVGWGRVWFAAQPLGTQLTVALVLGEVIWFLMLLPLFPSTPVGWVFVLVVGAIFGPAAFALARLDRKPGTPRALRVVVMLLILAFGISLPLFFFLQPSFVQSNLR